MNPLVYNRILVNEGNAWNPDTNTVTIPYTGYYLIHYGVGVPARIKAWHELYLGGTLITALDRQSKVHNGVDTIGKSIVRRFRAGNVLKLVTRHNTFSNANMQTAFMGLLLYED